MERQEYSNHKSGMITSVFPRIPIREISHANREREIHTQWPQCAFPQRIVSAKFNIIINMRAKGAHVNTHTCKAQKICPNARAFRA